MTATDFLAVAEEGRPALVGPKIDGLRKFLLLFGAARSWLWLIFNANMDVGLLVIAALLLTACATLAWVPRWAHVAPRIAVPLLFVELVGNFPFADNHFVLELLVVSLLALVGRDGDGESAVLQGILWVTAIVLFQTGLQKVLHGQYFGGEFLAFMVGRGDRFGDVFGWMLSPEEVVRLAAHDPLRSGEGPYRVESTKFVLASNAVYVAEMILAPLLVWKRTRTVAAIVALAFVVVIQTGAREIGFALVFVNLLLLFTPSDLIRKLVPVFGIFLLWVVLAAAGFLPGAAWIESGYM
ncbi:MAG: hypothetical protein P8R42_21145 [Candidatus Binatia bacterium]|nr:hypothetical protein [Candidatus Binatia bacterium]